MDEDIPLATVRNVVVVVDTVRGVQDLTFEYIRSDGVHVCVAMPLTLKPRDHGTRLLNRFRAHGIEFRPLRS